MTDDDKALVERLRDFVIVEDIDLAADRIEALSAENERLREGVWDIVEDVLADAYDIGKIEAEHHGYLHKRIRAALGEVK